MEKMSDRGEDVPTSFSQLILEKNAPDRQGQQGQSHPSSSSSHRQGDTNVESTIKPHTENKHVAEKQEATDVSDVIPFEQVTKELEVLNAEGQTRLYTGPYGRIQSPFKKFSSFSPRGVKRSPRKLPIPRSKKAKLLSKFDLLASDSSSESESDSSSSEVDTPEKEVETPAKVIETLEKNVETQEKVVETSAKVVDNAANTPPDKAPVVPGPSTKPQISPDLTGDDSEYTDSEEDKWQIMEDSESDIDKDLNTKSEKYSLSAINVKSIIHKIVTNEKVVEMVRKAVLEQVEEKRLEYEPKMTRSKAKEVLETHGDIPHPLGISPMKMNPKDRSKFVDIDLPDDEEDDEDFNPDRVEDIHGSEDDSESVASSGFSDCETTSAPSTPTTPTSQHSLMMMSSITPTNAESDNSNSFLSPMGPPLQNFVPRSQHKSSSLGQKYRDAIAKDEMSKREEEELIASRTRSKCPLNEVSLIDIEANFMAPDITEDLYDTHCDNQDWNDFLKTLIVFDSNTNEDTNDTVGEEEDPEFNFLEEAEEDEYDQEDFRTDRAVKVSKKELNLLIDELYEAYNENDPIDINSKNIIKARTETIVETKSHKRLSTIPENLLSEIGDHERRQISDQMRKHVQLLAQSFVLGMGDLEEHRNVVDAARMFLNELQGFSDRIEKVSPNNMYKACNLQAAVALVNDSCWTEKEEMSVEEKDRLNRVTFKYENQKVPNLNYKQIKVFWTNPVFMYPELLPHGGFYKHNEIKKDRSRVKFIEAEDNLLAMGLDQFNHLNNAKEYIHQFILPCKTKKQIQIRIKNLSVKTAKSNAVKYWKEHNRLPVFPQPAPYFNPSSMKACKDRQISLLEFPQWALFFRPEDAWELDLGDTKQRRKGKSSDKSLVSASGDSPSDAITPVVLTDSSNLVSSSSSGSSANSHTQPNRMKRMTGRKKLDLDQGKKQPVPAFIPLTFSGTIKCVSSSLTVTSLDKASVSSGVAVSPTSDTSDGTHPTVSVAPALTSVTPLPPLLALKNKNPVCTEPVRITPRSVGLFGGHNIAGTGVISKDGKIFVMAGQNMDMNVSAVNKGGNISSNKVSSNTKNTGSYRVRGASSENLITDSNASDLTSSCVQIQTSLQSSSTNDLSTSLPVDTSGLSTLTSTSSLSVLNANNNAVQTVHDSILYSSPSQSPGSYDTGVTCTPDRMSNSNCSTPSRGTLTSGSEGGSTPKNALEIIASYAPYLLSPSANKDQRKLLETTPKKKSEFIKLAPKPTPPGFSLSPTAPIHVPKVKSTPRRQRLKEQAKAILPKGFVIRSFDISPSKKAASNLIEKAKNPGRKSKSQSYYFTSSTGYCKILPHPDSGSVKGHESGSKTLNKINTNNRTESQTRNISSRNSGSNTDVRQVINRTDGRRTEREEPGVKDKEEDMDVDEEEDKGVDTESDYTQSEDGNETQEDVDSQEEIDSQEDDDNHIANLMHASTTIRFDPSKEDVSKHLGKKDRDRDTTLAMLAPDVIMADPQRDMRDTAFAQAYLHKVKKVLRDDMDILEQFLHLMFNFSKAKESPVQLYTELRGLFKDYPALLHDFSGFLLHEQAVECECFEAFEEFNMARSFLRKLELYFNKTPHHFQKIIKTFSRWYKKPGRRSTDLKSEVDPMLKGHKYLLEEFSKFFPEEPPPDGMLDEFEEINLDGSDEEINYDSFEEIELLEGEEVLGTKRCTCSCHDWRDETFRKKKKHCYRCCLTVIDGELVYRVNKSTIKKINITLGPPIKASSLLGMESDESQNTDINAGEKAVEVNREDNDPEGREELMQVDREPADLDSGCIVDSDGLERETSADGKLEDKHAIENIRPAVATLSSKPDQITETVSHVALSSKDEMERKSVPEPTCRQTELETLDKVRRDMKLTPTSNNTLQVSHNQAPAFSSVSTSNNTLQVSSSEASAFSSVSTSNNTLQVSSNEASAFSSVSISNNSFQVSSNEASAFSCVSASNNKLRVSPNEASAFSSVSTSNNTLTVSCNEASAFRSVSTSNNKLRVSPNEASAFSSVSTSNNTLTVSSHQASAFSSVSTSNVALQVSSNQAFVFSSVSPSNKAVSEKSMSDVSKSESTENNSSGEAAKATGNMKQGSVNLMSEMSHDKKDSEHVIQKSVSDVSNPSNSSSKTALADDILAAAFNAALMSEVSLDAAFPFPLATHFSQGKKGKGTPIKAVQEQSDKQSQQSSSSSLNETSATMDELKTPETVPDSSKTQTVPPAGQSQLLVSTNSSFTKVDSPAISESSPQSDSNIPSVDMPFSPFSPFGQEIQSITNAKSPAPYKVSSVAKVRRITPIPVKGSSGDDQSFQSVVQNSPVITDMIQSPLGQVVMEKSTGDSRLSNTEKASGDGSQQSVPVPFSDLGSNSVKSLESTSNKSAETEISSQKSNNADKSYDNTVGSSNYSTLKISQPNLFSEDANVGFTKTSELTNMSTHISEESLLQCLAKPPHFNDTIGTVSNLTNILNALDEKSVQFKSQDKNATKEKQDSVHSLKQSDSFSFSVTVSKQSSTDTVLEKVTSADVLSESDAGCSDKKDNASETTVVSSESSESVEKTSEDKYYPQSTLSIENLDRIQTGMFKVSSLSDSESSAAPTPSNSQTKQTGPHTGSGLSKSTDSHMEQKQSNNDLVSATEVTQTCAKLKEYPNDSKMSHDHHHQSNSIESETLKEVNDKNSAINFQTEHNAAENEPKKKYLEQQSEVLSVFQVEEKVTCHENNVDTDTHKVDNRTLSGETSGVKLLESETVDKEKSKKRKKKKKEHDDPEGVKKKKKKKKGSKEKTLDEMVVPSPDVSSQDSVTGMDQASDLHHKDLTSCLAISVDETDKVVGVQCSPARSVQSPGVISIQSGPSPYGFSPGQGSPIDSPAPSSCSSTGAVDEEPNWTKETDRIILEKCKSHGVKEKTFAKIAKQLGEYSSKQVRKRFHHLYQLIFGSQLNTEGGQETTSS